MTKTVEGFSDLQMRLKINLYIEYVGVAGSSASDYQTTLSAGVTYGISDDVQFDVGGRLGLN
ncbi:MAG: hypothetical protein H0W20_13850, partial [Chthoniobacterales bacterium]|nr:hypothetical protein [Chthoniobacterales bacterium]